MSWRKAFIPCDGCPTSSICAGVGCAIELGFEEMDYSEIEDELHEEEQDDEEIEFWKYGI